VKSPHIAIVGCGDIGIRVGTVLARSGWRVTGVRRNPEHLPAAFERCRADYTDADSLASLADGHPDYVLFTPVPADRTAGGYQRGYALAVSALASSGLLRRARGAVMVSSTRVFAEQDGGTVTEASPLAGDDPAAQAIIDAEELLHRHCGAAVVLRASGIYGAPPGALLSRVLRGEASADPHRISNRIHRDDLAAAIVHVFEALVRGATLPPTLIASDDEPAPIGEVEAWLARALGVDTLTPSQRAGPGRGNRRCCNRMLRATGFRLRYPSYREGYRAQLEAHPVSTGA